jgi:excisionase family DNA binding protein
MRGVNQIRHPMNKVARTPEAPTIPDSSEPWINTDAACKHIGISPVTMHRWIKSGKLKPKRTPGGEYRFRRSELDAVLD